MAVHGNSGMVGIFWLIGRRLIIDMTPLAEATTYGEFRIYDGDHVARWSKMERLGEVPQHSPYEEHPRGRVNYDTRTKHFNLLLDRCILRQKDVMKELMSRMHLPDDTEVCAGGIYRCSRCTGAGAHMQLVERLRQDCITNRKRVCNGISVRRMFKHSEVCCVQQ